MPLAGKGMLLTSMDIGAEHEADFNRWYDREHLEERVAIEGFLEARRYVAHAAPPKKHTHKTTTTNEVLYSPKFSRMYDLSTLGEGTYTFQVQGRSGEAYTRSYRFSYPGPEAIALDGSNGPQLVLQPEKRVVKR